MPKKYSPNTNQTNSVPWYLSFAFITIIIAVGCITITLGIGLLILIVGIVLIIKRRKFDKSLAEITDKKVFSTAIKNNITENQEPDPNKINHPLSLATDASLTNANLIVLDFLKKLKGHRPNERYEIFYFRKKSFVNKWYDFCINEELLPISSGYEILPFCTVDELKSILKEHSLKVSGRKAELVERIKENVAESELHLIPSLALTDKGIKIYDTFTAKSKKELQEMFNSAVNLLSMNKYIEAYEIMSLYQQKQVYHSSESTPPTETDIANYNMIYSKYSNKQIPALFKVSSLLGLSYDNSKKLITGYDSSIDYETIFYEFEKIRTIEKMESYKDQGYSIYEIDTCNDADVCDICTKFQNKTFYIKDYKIGVNAPPFHKGCRCMVFPYIN